MSNLFARGLLLPGACQALAQTTPGIGIGIGTTTPPSSAALDVSSTTKGLLPPRLTQAQRDAINPASTAGLTIYNTSTGKLNTWDGTRWDAGLSSAEQPVVETAVRFDYTGMPRPTPCRPASVP
jgi:hypothetical protein